MIQLIGDKKLALRFRNNAVSSREKFLYFLLSVILSLFFWFEIFSIVLFFSPFDTWMSTIFIPHDSWNATGKWDIFVLLFCLAIAILGTDMCYHSNRSGDNKDFIERYVCIGCLVFVHISKIAFLLFFILYGWLAHTNAPEGKSVYHVIAVIFLLWLFYFRLNKLIRIAAKNPYAMDRRF